MQTLLQGKEVEVKKVDGTIDKVTVRQLPLKDYKKGFEKCDDEFELVGLIIGKHVDFVYQLQPDSYETLLAECSKVNENGFFVYCDRRKKELAAQANMMRPEIVRAATERVLNSGSQPAVPRPV